MSGFPGFALLSTVLLFVLLVVRLSGYSQLSLEIIDMVELYGNIFDFIGSADAICVTTNHCKNSYGELVMGAGVAKAFKLKFPGIARIFGDLIDSHRGKIMIVETKLGCSIVAFPTKYHWKDKSDLPLIQSAAEQLVQLSNERKWKQIVLTRPGCGNGGLNWNQVKPCLVKAGFDNRFIILQI